MNDARAVYCCEKVGKEVDDDPDNLSHNARRY